MDARLRDLLPTAREVLSRSDDPAAVSLAGAIIEMTAPRPVRERMTAGVGPVGVPGCPACGRLFGSALSRGVLPEHGPVGDRCPGGLARVVWS